jgi:apolipoprotein N-acyltransferase
VAEPARRLAFLGGYAIASFASFPHPLGDRVVDLGGWVAWLAPALLLLGLQGLAPRRAAALGFAAGLAAHAAILHWIYVVTVVYGHAPPVVGWLAPVALALYIAGFTGAFGAGIAWLARRGLASPWAAALWWTCLDHLRSFLLTGFPWATLGYAQHANGALVGLAAWTGVYGLSFVTVLGGAALAQVVRERRLRAGPLLAAGVVAAAHLPGLLAGADPERGEGRIRVAVLQGNIDQGVKWDPQWFERTLSIYEELSRQAATRGAELIVWPESALPVGLDGERSAGLRGRLGSLARELEAGLVLGGVGLDLGPDQRPSAYYDSAFVVAPDGRFLERYDKAHLVPFGEYVPFQRELGRLLRAVARGIAAIGVTPGTGPRSLALPRPDGAPAVSAGVPICYELIFPDLVRRFVRDGAGMLLAITNDAWYGRTGAPFQFLAITAVRSAETRVWTARAANTGVSAFIDARGRVRSRTRIFERGLLVEDVPYRPPPIGGSFYTRHGDVFAATCWIGIAVLGFVGWARSRRR